MYGHWAKYQIAQTQRRRTDLFDCQFFSLYIIRLDDLHFFTTTVDADFIQVCFDFDQSVNKEPRKWTRSPELRNVIDNLTIKKIEVGSRIVRGEALLVSTCLTYKAVGSIFEVGK